MSEADLLRWLSAPSADRGIRFALPKQGWDFHSYRSLAQRAEATAAELRAVGVRPGGVVAVIRRGGPEFVADLFGTLLAGATACPVAPPSAFGDRESYRRHLDTVLDTARPVVVRCGDEFADVVGERDFRPRTLPDVPALVQFTSGSTGKVRGVRVSRAALAANLAAIRRWLGMTPADPTASWLPVHHDMGLVGCLLAPVVTGSDLWLLSPSDFVRRPMRYLECFDAGGARLTAMPAFGLAHLADRVRPEQVRGLDLRAWRAVIVGAERVSAAVLERFTALLSPAGFAAEALLPAYGLAEATLAATAVPLGRGWRTHAQSPGEPAVTGCGTTLSGVRVSIVDSAGSPVPDGDVGEIVVGGDCVGTGYVDGQDFGAAVRTGDAGYLLDGELYPLGRFGDSVKVRGRAVFAEDLELLVSTVFPDRPACALGHARGHPEAVVVLERPRARDASDEVTALLRPHLDGVRIVVLRAKPGVVPRTSSGKPRRAALWAAYLSGELT
ncbi:AMP-binding protein [Amycolatopsis sp. CA-230715]|uniref:AMP-binding protein n=1 Tax=Amycolatopsis sp. CA-230715 TaxID=2745196 RepID=UPI001C035F4F|nr:AMP-binding protein [Amycolatopsis sp. CA-230715]QWF84813.1 Putative fatty-acid--CoA ligase fadD25 [Amycolatopsis sp. CA-230715]